MRPARRFPPLGRYAWTMIDDSWRASTSRLLPILYQRYANDTMFVLWRKAGQFDPDRARFSTWLSALPTMQG